MVSCKHTKLALLRDKKNRLRCRHCHLTITADDLGEGYCPECFEIQGNKLSDFEKLEAEETGINRYRCEECGIIIESE